MLCNQNFSSNFTKRKRRPYRLEGRQADRQKQMQIFGHKLLWKCIQSWVSWVTVGFNNNRRLIKCMRKVSTFLTAIVLAFKLQNFYCPDLLSCVAMW